LSLLSAVGRPRTAQRRPSEAELVGGKICLEGAGMDVVELMDWLAERGCSVVFKADGGRPLGQRWMVIASGGDLGEESFFRSDLASAGACLQALLDHLETVGLSPLV